MTVDVRPARTADTTGVRRVITAALADGGLVADLADDLRRRPDIQAGLVAVDGEQVVGHTHLSISWLDAPNRLVDVLTLSPLAVAPEYQSRGIGGRLLDEAIVAANRLGAPLVFLEGSPTYYSHRGWLPAAEHGFTSPSARIPPAAFRVVLLDAYEAAEMSGALIYNDTFWSHDRVGLRAPIAPPDG